MSNLDKITKYWQEDKRIIYKGISFNLNSNPRSSIDPLSNEGIQTIIKNKISKDNLQMFLFKKINEDSIEDYRKLFEDSFFNQYLEIKETPRKYLFDLIIAILFEEILSFNQVEAILSDRKDAALALFEKMIVLEYNLYTLSPNPPSAVAATFKSYPKQYVMNYIPTIFHGVPGVKSYKDESNLEDELKKIFNPLMTPLYPANNQGSLSYFRLAAQDSLFDFKSTVRVNKKEAHIEGDKISTYSFLLNYNRELSINNTFNIEIVRKYQALSNVGGNPLITYGFYRKDNSSENIYFNDIKNYSYYPFLTSKILDSNRDVDFRRCHNFLKKYGEQIIERTINY
jgi:hypothetical protein